MFDVLRRNSNFYRYFQRNATLNGVDENCDNYSFEYKGKRILLKKTRKKTNKYIIVTCSDHTVSAVRLVPITVHTVATENEFNVDVAGLYEKYDRVIVVISGKPGLIKGLDEGVFVSASSIAKGKESVYVMSEARFRTFEM